LDPTIGLEPGQGVMRIVGHGLSEAAPADHAAGPIAAARGFLGYPERRGSSFGADLPAGSFLLPLVARRQRSARRFATGLIASPSATIRSAKPKGPPSTRPSTTSAAAASPGRVGAPLRASTPSRRRSTTTAAPSCWPSPPWARSARSTSTGTAPSRKP
jgi:hypothetical protein